MAKLAIRGGEPVRTGSWPVWPIYDERELQGVREVLESRCWCALPYIFEGKGRDFSESKVAQLEQAYAAYHDCAYGIAVDSGSAALLISYAAAGVGHGDEVIMPPRSFVTTASAALALGAIPVFVDIEAEWLNLDPTAIEAAITERTKAIVPVHCGGIPCEMDAIMTIAQRHHLMVIGDACHAHGSEWRGKKVAAAAHLSAFSFQQDKSLTAGEGGMIVTNDEVLGARCRKLGQRVGQDEIGRFEEMGWNFRMSEFAGAIVLAQFGRLDDLISVKEANAAHLASALAGVTAAVRFPTRDPRMTRLSHLYPTLHYDAEALGGLPAARFAEALSAEGIPCSAVTAVRALHQHPMFVEKRFDPGILRVYGKELDYTRTHCPVAEGYAGKFLSLPQTVLLGGQQDMDLFAEAVAKIRDATGELVESGKGGAGTSRGERRPDW
jgi:dTDP-4-amino-4,6-dideoxygalactose transaminase